MSLCLKHKSCVSLKKEYYHMGKAYNARWAAMHELAVNGMCACIYVVAGFGFVCLCWNKIRR